MYRPPDRKSKGRKRKMCTAVVRPFRFDARASIRDMGLVGTNEAGQHPIVNPPCVGVRERKSVVGDVAIQYY